MTECVVEVFGGLRELLKASEVALELGPGATLGDLVAALARREVRLVGRVIAEDTNGLVSPYVLYQEGRGFVDDPGHRVEPGDRFVLMLATVGG